MSKIIPNTFQTPNAHVDDAMYLLTPEEYKVLNFAVRHIYGWQVRVHSISLTMFVKGFPNKKSGGHFNGTGLNRVAVLKCLGELTKYKLLVPEGTPDAKGQAWMIGEDPDWEGLETRGLAASDIQRARTAAARAKRAGMSDILVCPTDQERYVSHTTAGMSDIRNQSQSKSQSKELLAASDEGRAIAAAPAVDFASVKAHDSATDVTTPPSLSGAASLPPATKPRVRSAAQLANDALVEALRQAFFKGRKLPVPELGRTDYGNYQKRARELVDGGIPTDTFQAYVEYWHKAAVNGGWTLTLNSLTSGGRMADYKAFAARGQNGTGTTSAPRYDPTRDPAYAPLTGGVKK